MTYPKLCSHCGTQNRQSWSPNRSSSSPSFGFRTLGFLSQSWWMWFGIQKSKVLLLSGGWCPLDHNSQSRSRSTRISKQSWSLRSQCPSVPRIISRDQELLSFYLWTLRTTSFLFLKIVTLLEKYKQKEEYAFLKLIEYRTTCGTICASASPEN